MASKTDNEVTGIINIIGNGTSIHGDVASNGDFRIDGAIQGKFVTKLKLVIGPTGFIEGDIECKDCEIFGKVRGNILAHETLVLRETAEVCGDIRINRLSIEPGAVFTGHCSMLNVAVPEEVAE